MNSAFLKACRCEKTAYTPVWLMRQAGRYMKDYRDVREKTPFMDLCKNEDLAAEVTVTAQEKIKADAAIIFSDILLILEPLGLQVAYVKGDGPSIKEPLRNAHDVESLKEVKPGDSLAFVYGAIRKTRAKLKPEIPLIGFAGAPFTLASYMIEGGSSKDFSKTKELMNSSAFPWQMLMEKISQATVKYLEGQITAGVQVLQLFDSWAGILSPAEYRKYVLPYSKKVMQGLRGKVPVIHFGTRTGPFLEDFSSAGGDVIGVDDRISLKQAMEKIGPEKAIQGNLDPKILLTTIPEIKQNVKRILSEMKGRPGYIFNLGHGVLPQTPVENVIALIEMVHEFSHV